MKRFGEKLRILRNRDGVSLRKLTAEMGYSSHNHLAGIERGERKPSVELVIKIALFFNVSTDQLLMDDLEVD
ncbi:MAG: helix-turn-helix transcriptional regulator [Deltaproteobacteria bacterium]|nr:helix-turn-helix transcriptional regulator [Deltaproteobacteria bacterium]